MVCVALLFFLVKQADVVIHTFSELYWDRFSAFHSLSDLQS